jgi:hypothetical protein
MPLVLGTDYFGSTVSRERSMQLMDHYLDAGGNVDSLQFGPGAPNIDFAANAASLGALSEKVTGIPGLEAALTRARAANRTYLICIETDDTRITKEGGWWWEVAVPEESPSESVQQARAAYLRGKREPKTIINLLIKPQKDSQQIVSVTPASAGWRYITNGCFLQPEDHPLVFFRAPLINTHTKHSETYDTFHLPRPFVSRPSDRR